MNNNQQNRILIIGISLLLFIVIFLPYYLTFKEFGISNNTTNWGEYGSYIAGISSFLNLIVFIVLTIYVARLGNMNNKKQIQTQNKILISQFRQSALEKLDEQLDLVFQTNGIEDKEDTLSRYSNAAIYLTNFLNQKKYLFPILDLEDIKSLGMNILNKLSEFIDLINSLHGKEGIGDSMDQKIFTKVQATAYLKNDFIEKLQLFILRELEE